MSLIESLISEDLLGRDAIPGVLQSSTVAKREVFIAIRRDGRLGDGTKKNPYDGSIRDRLDRILNGDFDATVKAPVRFVFGPGIFRTAGCSRNSDNPVFWLGIRSGQEFVGSGMFATTFRLEIPDPLENAGYGVFGQHSTGSGDDILIQDMTVDCDMQNQKPTGSYGYARIMTSAGGVAGKRNKVKRVRVINAGTRTPNFEFGYKAPQGSLYNRGLECFPKKGSVRKMLVTHFTVSGISPQLELHAPSAKSRNFPMRSTT